LACFEYDPQHRVCVGLLIRALQGLSVRPSAGLGHVHIGKVLPSEAFGNPIAPGSARYGEAFERMGLKLFSGGGGFYHWCRLPRGQSAADLNDRVFPEGAAVLMGTDCDMARRGSASPLDRFFRFSFGPLEPGYFDGDMEIMRRALEA